MTPTTVIVGASIGGVRTAQALRCAGYDGEVVLDGEERVLPYDKPPLSKALLAGTATADVIALLTEQAAADAGIRLVLAGRPPGCGWTSTWWSWPTASGSPTTTSSSRRERGRGRRRGASRRGCTCCAPSTTPSLSARTCVAVARW
jgi:hypothetical protein